MYYNIIKEIESNLTEDNQYNKIYLTKQMDKYREHEYSKEIIRELGRLFWDCLSDEEMTEYANVIRNENPVRDALNKANSYVVNKDLGSALNVLKEFIESCPAMYEDDEINEYHSFSNPIEELLFLEYIGCEKELRYVPDHHPFVSLYYSYGFLLLDFGKFDEAEKALQQALKFNPVSTQVIYEIGEIYKCKKDWDTFYKNTCEGLKYAYSSELVARGYRNLGFYFIEKNKLEVATALFLFSLTFENSQMVKVELEYIASLGFRKQLSYGRVIEIIEENNIQLGCNPKIFNILFYLIEDAKQSYSLNVLKYLYNILYDLSRDDDVLDKIKEIDIKLNE